MSSFTVFTLLLAGMCGGAFALTRIVPELFFRALDKVEDNKKAKQKALENTPEYQAELLKKRNAINSIDKSKKLDFVNVKNNEDLFNIKLREEFQFDIDKDIVVKGILRCKDKNLQDVEMPIYLYQPRLFAANNGKEVCIGPKTTKDGKLDNKYMYLVKKPVQNSSLYYGYVPKAEISSGSEFDFVKDNPFNNNKKMLNFINITLNTDAKGRTMPINLKDARERQELLNYIEKYKNTNIFYEYVQVAKELYDELLEKERMERIKEEARYERMKQRYSSSQKNEEQKEEKVDKEREAYRQYYEDQYGYLGAKSSYNKMREIMEDAHENGIPMPPPPPRGPRK